MSVESIVEQTTSSMRERITCLTNRGEPMFTALVTALLQAASTQLPATPPNVLLPPACVFDSIRVVLLKDGKTPVASIAPGCRLEFPIEDESPSTVFAIRGLSTNATIQLPAWIKGRPEHRESEIYVYIDSMPAVSMNIPVVVTLGGKTNTVNIGISRRAKMFLPGTDDCPAGNLCPSAIPPTHVEFRGTNLHELDASQPLTFLDISGPAKAPGQSAATIPFTVRNGTVHMTLRKELKHGTGYLVLGVRRRNLASSEITSDTLLTVMIEQPLPNSRELRFGKEKALTLFVGDAVTVSTSVDSAALRAKLVNPNILKIVEDGSKLDKPVAFMQVLNRSGLVRISAAAPTTRPTLRTEEPGSVLIYSGDDLVGHAHMQVLVPPQIQTTQVVHTTGFYTDGKLRPGEKSVQVTLTGNGLDVYDDTLQMTALSSAVIRNRTSTRIDIAVDVKNDAVSSAEIILPSRLTVPASVRLEVVPHLRPQPLSFAQLRYPKGKQDSAKEKQSTAEDSSSGGNNVATKSSERPDSTTRVGRVLPDGIAEIVLHGDQRQVRIPKLKDLAIAFDRSRIDRGTEFGPQYLNIEIAYYAPDNSLKARDTLRVVVANDSSVVVDGYDPTPELSINNILQDRLRYSKPGAYVDVTVRHDASRYQAAVPTASTIRVRNTSRWRIEPQASVFSGMLYLGKVKERKSEIRVLPNGATADTLKRLEDNKNFKFDLLDMVGGAAAVEFRWLKDDLRPSLGAFSLAAMVARDPFKPDKPRSLGISVLYPYELLNIDGQVSLGVSAGFAYFIGNRWSRWFGVFAPGVNFTIPK